MKKEKMEKGKRIEFKGVAKIVILAIAILAITGITAIEAFSANDCLNCPGSGLKLLSEKCWGRENSLYCNYNATSDKYTEHKGEIYVHKYNSLNQAKSDFESTRRYRNPLREITILEDSPTEFTFIATDRSFPDIVIYGYSLDIDRKIITKVKMEVYTPHKANNEDIAKAEKNFDAFAKCANSIITGLEDAEDKEEYTLTLKHYLPYYKPGKNEI